MPHRVYANTSRSPVARAPARPLRRTLLLAAPLLLQAQLSAAQLPADSGDQTTTPHGPSKIDKVIVTASPFSDQDELQSLQPGAVITRDAVARARAASLGDTLSGQAGIQSSSFGAGASRPIIRGLDGPRVKTTESGMASADVSTISPDHAVASETLGARQVEILRGPATLLYGSGAMGGLVNVVTDRIPQAHSNGAQLLTDTRASSAERTRDLGAQLRTSVESFAFTGEVSDRASGNLKTAHQGRLANSDTAARNASAGASWIAAHGFVGVGVNRYESNYGIASPDATRIDLARDRLDALGEFSHVMGLERLRFSASSNRYQHAEIEANGSVGTVFRNRASSARFDLQTRPSGGWRTVIGSDLERSQFSAIGEETIVPLTQSKNYALFAVTERALGAGRIEIGARLERVTHAPTSPAATPATATPRSEPTLARRGFSLNNGSVGYQWQLSRDSALSATFSHAERAPAIEELYSKGAHVATLTYDLGNPNLARERSQNLDLSYKLRRGAWQVNASVFQNVAKDFIYGASTDDNGDAIADRVNQDGGMSGDATLLKRVFRNVDARFVGAELAAAYAPPSGVGFSLMGDTVRGTLTRGDSGYLPRMSPTRVGAKVSWRGGKSGSWFADVGATHVFAQNRLASFETRTPGFTRVDASLRYRAALEGNQSLDVYVLGKNLGNRDMRVHTSFLKDFAPLPGRSVFAGVLGSF